MDDIQEIISTGTQVLQSALDDIAILRPSKTTQMLGVSNEQIALAVTRKFDDAQENLAIVVLKLAETLSHTGVVSQREVARELDVLPGTLNRRLHSRNLDNLYREVKSTLAKK